MKNEPLSKIRQAKNALRRQLRATLREMTLEARAAASLEICRRAAQAKPFRAARCVALFASLPTEPDLRPLIEEAWAGRKRVALPLMFPRDGKPHLEWHAFTAWDELTVQGPLHVREPDPARCPLVDVAEIDCAFIPGLAFDNRGHRLGRGGGYYDSFLARLGGRIPCLGLMFACQRVDSVPHEAHDQKLSAVLTE